MPLLGAFGVNLFAVPFASLMGAWTHRRRILWKLLPPVLSGGVAGAVLGALLAGLFAPVVLAILFLFLSTLTVLGLFAGRWNLNRLPGAKERAWVMLVGSFFLNLLAGVRGGSGGFLLPLLLKAATRTIRPAIATSLVTTVVTAVAAVFVYWNRGDIILPVAVAVTVGSVLGARVGGVLSLRTRPRWLETGVAVLVIAFAILTVVKAVRTA